MIERAVALLKAGELVAFPTETVYGLGADASNERAIKKIFEVKQRPADHPIIVHIANKPQLKTWVENISPAAETLIEYFWPGPMTLIFTARKNVSPLITGHQTTIGVRMPAHPVACMLLEAFGGAIAAPSANRFGHVSPTQAAHVYEELGDKVSLVIEGGSCAFGIESTIIDVTHTPPCLLRPGPWDVNQIKEICGIEVVYPDEKNKKTPRVSGNLPSHYAPNTPLYLFNRETAAKLKNKNIGVIAFYPQPETLNKIHWIVLSQDPIGYARQLYATLRELDAKNLREIWVEMPPDNIAWEAIRDRLQRASVHDL